MKKIILISLLLLPSTTLAQFPWSGILDPTRAIDWSSAHVGLPGGIPSGTWTQCGGIISPSGGDDTPFIQPALNSCAANQYVLLASGNFNITCSLNVPTNTVLRGQGANLTTVNFNTNSTCVNAFAISLGYVNGASGSSPSYSRTTNITSTNSKGDTTITVASATGITGGTSIVWIADLNTWDASCGIIGTFSTSINLTPDEPCVSTAAVVTGNFGAGGASGFAMDGNSANWAQRGSGQMDLVTNVTGTTLTLKDPLQDSFRHTLPDWQPNFLYFQGTAIHPSTQPTHVYFMNTVTSNGSTGPIPCTSGPTVPTFPIGGTVTDGSSTPQCVWQDAGPATDSMPRLMYFTPATSAGLENLQVFVNNNVQFGNFQSTILISACNGCWVSGVEVNHAVGFIVDAKYSYDGVIESNYFTGAWNHGSGSDSVVNLDIADSGFLVDNNIFERTPESAFTDHGATGNVIAYNYGVGQWGANGLSSATNSILSHDAWPRFNLIEGNVAQMLARDAIHGGNGYDTFFRNWILGTNLICNPVSALGLNVGGSLVLPGNPTVTTNATGGTTTYNYRIEAVVGGAQSAPSATPGTSISNGPATLSSTVFNTITAPNIAAASQCLVYRTVGGPVGMIGSIPCNGSTSLNDTGQAVQGPGMLPNGTSYVPNTSPVCSPQGNFYTSTTLNAWLSYQGNWPIALTALSMNFNSVNNIHGSTALNTLATNIGTTEQRLACSVCDLSCGPTNAATRTACGPGSRQFTPSIVDETFGYTQIPPATPYDSTLAQDTYFRCKNYYNSTYQIAGGTGPFTAGIETGNCASGTVFPASFYLSAKPTWWNATLAYPAIGTDISGGSYGFGFVNPIPAQNCYLTVMGGVDGGAGGPYAFNANTCYGAPPPPAPTPNNIIKGPVKVQGDTIIH